MKIAKEGDTLSTTEQTHEQDLERLKSLRYMDDDFMTVCLADNFEGVELILRIILGQAQKGQGITAVCWMRIY